MASSWLCVSDEVDEDVCPVCIDIYVDPIMLSCKHNYCKECALLLVKKESTASNFYIECAICEKKTVLGKDKKLRKLKNRKLKKKSQKILDKRDSSEIKELEHKLSQLSGNDIVMPRNIKLLQEYDAAIGKDGKSFIPEEHNGMVSYGTEETKNSDDMLTLSNWHGMIIGPQDSPIGQVIYFLKITVPDNYPKEPPMVKFTGPKVVMECVDSKGNINVDTVEIVDISKVGEDGCVKEGTGSYFVWSPSKSIADILVAVRNNMYLHEVCRLSGSISSQYYA